MQTHLTEQRQCLIGMQVLARGEHSSRAEGEDGVDAPLLPEIELGAANEQAGRPAVTSSIEAPSAPPATSKGPVRMLGVRIQEPMVVESMSSRSGRSHPATRRGRAPVRCPVHLIVPSVANASASFRRRPMF